MSEPTAQNMLEEMEEQRRIAVESAPLNNLSYWFPRLLEAGIPVPRTEIIEVDADGLWPLVDGQFAWGLAPLAQQIIDVAELVGGMPCFLRTGHGSGKHYWKNTCYLPEPNKIIIAQHIRELVEWSCCVDFIGLPFETWVVRELMPVGALFTAFNEMPITRERRCFVQDGELICSHPYWPPEAIQGASDEAVELLRVDNALEKSPSTELIQQAAELFEGAWSQDWLWTARGWVLIDMATAKTSFHWDGCPHVFK
jgi:hypothetical protein